MRPQDDYRNGDEGGGGGSEGSRGGSGSGSEEGSGGEGDDLSLWDPGAPARALNALNALRKSRQHYDVVLVADGAEVPAHRAVLAAASPYLLEALQSAPSAAAHRVEGVEAECVRALVEYAYTGRLRVRSAAEARRLYRAAWRLRVEPARAHLAAQLLRRPRPADCLALRALPGLAPDQLQAIDDYIANNFDEICESGALAALPVIQMELLRESSAEDGGESAVCVADAALAWLRARRPVLDLEELCSRTHLLFVDGRGLLRDCGELPARGDEPPEVGEYRREAAAAARRARPPPAAAAVTAAAPAAADSLGARVCRSAAADWGVVAARAVSGGTRALVALRGALAAASLRWRAGGGGGGVQRGGVLGGGPPAPAGAAMRAPMSDARAALGAAALDDRLIVCGGYDRARVLKSAEAYDPMSNTWSALPDMRSARARFPAAKLGAALYVLGGSDGHAELDSVDVLEDGVWKAKTKLPLARGHAAAVVDEASGELYVVGGWAGGLNLKRVDKYSPAAHRWTEAPPLITGRSQCAGVVWAGAVWALGGCDTWRCLASTESLPLEGGDEGERAWAGGPPLPLARRGAAGAAWRRRLVCAGGSDGAASLARVDCLEPGVRVGVGGGVGVGAEPSAWRALSPLRSARANLALASLRDVLYAVGGFDGKHFLSSVECLYEPDGEWTALCDAALSPQPAPAPPTPDGDDAGARE